MADMDQDMDEVLIRAVQAHPCIWKLSRKDHKVKTVVDAAWREINVIMGHIGVDAVKTRWRSKRDRFNKLRKDYDLPSGSAKEKGQKWAYYDMLSFLIEKKQHRR